MGFSDPFKSCQPKLNRSAFLCVFDRVGEKIDQNLIQPRLISHHTFLTNSCDGYVKALPPGPGCRADDRIHGRYRITERERVHGEHHFSALNLGNIQNVIDQAQKMLAGHQNLPGIFPHFFRTVCILFQQSGKSQNRIHGSADIMGHIGQKGSLGTVGNLSFLKCFRKLCIMQFPFLSTFFPELFLLSFMKREQYTAEKEG